MSFKKYIAIYGIPWDAYGRPKFSLLVPYHKGAPSSSTQNLSAPARAPAVRSDAARVAAIPQAMPATSGPVWAQSNFDLDVKEEE